MKLGLVTYNLAHEWDFDTLERNCIETGFTGVELRTQHAHGIEVTLDQTARKTFKKRIMDSPIDVVGLVVFSNMIHRTSGCYRKILKAKGISASS